MVLLSKELILAIGLVSKNESIKPFLTMRYALKCLRAVDLENAGPNLSL